MTLTQQQKDALKQQFQGVTDQDLSGSDQDMVRNIAERTGQSEDQIRQQVEQFKQGGQQGQTQS